MQKKILYLFIILLGIFVIGYINVQAEDDDNDTTDETDTEETTAAWPKDFTYEDYSFTITGIYLNVYSIDTSKTVHIDEDTTENEDMTNYLKEEPTTVITLDPTKYTINPEFKEDKLSDINAILVDLNLNLTKEQLEAILEEQINNTSSTVSYIVDIMVKYKINNYPEDYKNAYRFNYFRDFIYAMYSMSDTYNGTNTLEELGVNLNINLENETSQILNLAIIGKENEESDTVLHYETDLSQEEGWVDYVKNFTIFSTKELEMLKVSTDEEDNSGKQILMFHDIDGIDYLVQNMKINESNNNLEETISKITEDQQVIVPNTAMTRSIVWTMLGVVAILSGIMIIMYVKKIKQFRKIEYLGED